MDVGQYDEDRGPTWVVGGQPFFINSILVTHNVYNNEEGDKSDIVR